MTPGERPLRLWIAAACLLLAGGTAASGSPPIREAYYPTYDQIAVRLRHLQQSSPEVVHVREIGRSADGRPILAAKVSDNPAVEEDEPSWIFVGVIHGREPLGVRVAYALIEGLVSAHGSSGEVAALVNSHQVWVVPVQNPWGYDRNRRKNGDAPGVDLNRNYDFRWERCEIYQAACVDPASSYYRGSAPFSEPEARAVRDLALEVRPRFGIDFHAGNPYPNSQVMRPWSSGRPEDPVAPPAEHARLQGASQRIAGWIMEARSAGGFCQPGSAIFDPAVCRTPATALLAPMGQASNWFHASFGTQHYVVEISQRLYNDRFFYTADLADDDPRSVRQAEEYVRGMTWAVMQWLRSTLPPH